ncbi:MAG: sce7725 family protein [Nibricoccus sp.]
MPYYPLLRTKQNEMLAVREASEAIASSRKVFPVFEPVRTGQTLVRSFQLIAQNRVEFGLIINPSVGDYTNAANLLEQELFGPLRSESVSYVPFLMIGANTASTSVSRILNRYPTSSIGVVITAAPADPGILQVINGEARIQHAIILERRVSRSFAQLIHRSKSITFNDRFNRAERNADYPDDEFFCDRSNPTNGGIVNRYGDFSIVGENFSESGGPAYAVALHHIYRHKSGDLHIRHYVSDQTETPDDPAAKYIEALSKCVADLRQLGQLNNTPTCEIYRDLLRKRHFPGLGAAKKHALRHHFELICAST